MWWVKNSVGRLAVCGYIHFVDTYHEFKNVVFEMMSHTYMYALNYHND